MGRFIFQEGTFQWTDGYEPVFEDFETGQPNEGVPPEDCVDIDSSSKNEFISLICRNGINIQSSEDFMSYLVFFFLQLNSGMMTTVRI